MYKSSHYTSQSIFHNDKFSCSIEVKRSLLSWAGNQPLWKSNRCCRTMMKMWGHRESFKCVTRFVVLTLQILNVLLLLCSIYLLSSYVCFLQWMYIWSLLCLFSCGVWFTKLPFNWEIMDHNSYSSVLKQWVSRPCSILIFCQSGYGLYISGFPFWLRLLLEQNPSIMRRKDTSFEPVTSQECLSIIL